MSIHGTRSKSRHPHTTKAKRERFDVAHVAFEVCDHPENGQTFALYPGLDELAPKKPPLFSGHIEKGMGTQLRRLAHRVDELESKLAKES